MVAQKDSAFMVFFCWPGGRIWCVGSIRHALPILVEHPKSYVSHTIKHRKTLKDRTDTHTQTHIYTHQIPFLFQPCAGQNPVKHAHVLEFLVGYVFFLLEKKALLDVSATSGSKRGGKNRPVATGRILLGTSTWTGAIREAVWTWAGYIPMMFSWLTF